MTPLVPIPFPILPGCDGPLSSFVSIDDAADVLRIGPIRVAGHVLRSIAPTQPGVWLRIEEVDVERGVVTVRQKYEDPSAPNPEGT